MKAGSGKAGVTEYLDPPENPGPSPNFTEKVGPLTQKTSYFLLKALEIRSPLALVSREVPRFHGGSLWHSTPAALRIVLSI